ncbi:MAG: hypothetical protein ACYS0E_10105 [Planctomycetota bacterium]|jgi:hypothetical protein
MLSIRPLSHRLASAVLLASLVLANACGGSGRLSGPVAAMQIRVVEVTPSSVLIGWDPVPRATHYRLFRNGTEVGFNGENASGWGDNLVDPGQTYRYAVKAYRAGSYVGEEHLGSSETVVVTTPSAANWAREEIGPWGGASNVLIDSDDVLHLVHCSRTTDLRYMTHAAGAWTETTLGDVCSDVRQAFGPHGRLHVIYRRGKQLLYLQQEAGGWTTEEIAADLSSRSDISLAVTAGGTVHVAYVKEHFGLQHAVLAGGAWVQQQVDDDPRLWKHAMFADERVHLLFYADGVLFDWTDASGDWSIEVAGSVKDYSLALQVHGGIGGAIDGDGVLHVVTYGEESIEHLTRDAAGWSQEAIEPHISHRGGVSVAIDAQGALHVSYEALFSDLKYATNASGGWESLFLAAAGLVGDVNSIAADSTGLVHVLYRDTTEGVLWLVRGRMFP